MELPKNIVQIGKPDRIHKIFVEDYVISYIKQWNRNCDGQAAGLALYGKYCEEEGLSYYFLYGAAKIDGLEHRGPYLSQVEKEEIEDIGKRYFEEYRFLAWCSVKGEPVESFYVQMQGKGVEINGYACFYEKNESMLNYMLLADKPEKAKIAAKSGEPEKPGRGEWKAADYRKPSDNPVREKSAEVQNALKAKKTPPTRKTEYMKIAVAAVFLVLCVVGITTLNDYDKLEDLQVAARQVIASMSEQKLPDAGQEDNGISANTVSGQESNGTPANNIVRAENNAQNVATQEPQASLAPQETPLVPQETPSAPQQTPSVSQETEAPTPSEQPVMTEQLPVSYTIVKGDTLNSICMTRYGSLKRVKEVCELNGIENADNIAIGQTILLPQ